MKYYVWLNLENGKFSNSWTQEEHNKYFTENDLEDHYKKDPAWKHITYECVNDKEFMFTRLMTIR